jgi:hypothetical protein
MIELLINGWPEDGLLEAETCSNPHSVINIILALCLADFLLLLPLSEFQVDTMLHTQV